MLEKGTPKRKKATELLRLIALKKEALNGKYQEAAVRVNRIASSKYFMANNLLCREGACIKLVEES